MNTFLTGVTTSSVSCRGVRMRLDRREVYGGLWGMGVVRSDDVSEFEPMSPLVLGLIHVGSGNPSRNVFQSSSVGVAEGDQELGGSNRAASYKGFTTLLTFLLLAGSSVKPGAPNASKNHVQSTRLRTAPQIRTHTSHLVRETSDKVRNPDSWCRVTIYTPYIPCTPPCH